MSLGDGDSIYGGGRTLRFELEQRGQLFVLAVPSNEPLWRDGPSYMAAQAIAMDLPPEAWHRLSAGDGAKGPRWYDWAWQPLWRLQLTIEERAQGRWLLIRRSLDDPTDLYYVVFAPRAGTTLETVVRVAGARWQIEASFEAAKSECGLDEYEVRTWDAWHRHITLALLAHAVLIVVQTQEQKKGHWDKRPPAPHRARSATLTLSVAEGRPIQPGVRVGMVPVASTASMAAKRCHYKKRRARGPT